MLSRSFIKNVVILSFGTGLAQVVTVVCSPLLTRLYDPADFGVFTLFSSIVGIISVLSTGRLELAILLPKGLREAIHIAQTTWIYIVVFCVLVFLFSFIPGSYPDLLGEYKYLVAIACLPAAVCSLYNYLALRFKAFKTISLGQILQSASNNGLSLALGWFNIPGGLILGFVAGQLTNAFTFMATLHKIPLLRQPLRVAAPILARYKQFPTINSLSALANIGSNQAPVLFMSAVFSDMTLGFYGLIMKVLNTPLHFLGRTISQVLFGHVSELEQEGTLRLGYLLQISGILFLLISLILVPFYFIGEEFFALVFGEEWAIAGRIFQYFIPFYILRFVYYSISSVLIVKRKLKTELMQNLVALAVQLLALLIGCVVYRDSDLCFRLIGWAGSLSYAFFLFQVMYAFRTAKTV